MPVVLRILPTLSAILSASFIKTVHIWIILTLVEIFPCFMLIYWVGSMVHVVYKQDRSARILAKQIRFNHHVLYKSHEKTTLKIMLIVVGLFLVCYCLLIRCSILLLSFNFTKKCNDTEYKIPLLVLNSAINPLAYALLKRDVKKEVKKVTSVLRFKQDKWTSTCIFSTVLSRSALSAILLSAFCKLSFGYLGNENNELLQSKLGTWMAHIFDFCCVTSVVKSQVFRKAWKNCSLRSHEVFIMTKGLRVLE